jgi:hypothetical protein
MIIRKNVTADWIIGLSFSRRMSLCSLKMSNSSTNDPSPALLDRPPRRPNHGALIAMSDGSHVTNGNLQQTRT